MHTHSNGFVGNVGEKLAAHLDVIRGYFKPGAVVTLVVRPGDAADGDFSRDMILTSDKTPKVIAALQHHLTAADTQHAEVMAEES